MRLLAARQIGLILVYSILALAVLWPLPLHFDHSIIGWGGDPLLQTWALCWNVHWWNGGAETYFDANINHPEKTTFAFHDPLFAQGLLFYPIQLASGNPILGYNTLILLTYILGGWGVCLCGRALGLSPLASFAAGSLFVFSPTRVSQVVHLNILSTQWIPFSVLFLLLLLRRRGGSWLHALGFALFASLAILSSFYNGLALGLLAGVIGIGSLVQRRLGRHHILQLAAAAAVIALALWPFVAALYQVSERYGERRSIEENIRNSATPLDFTVAHKDSLLYGPLMRWHTLDPPITRRTGEKALFPGLVPVLLAAAGCLALLRQKADRVRGEWILILIAGLLGLILCLGPALSWAGSQLPLPYRLIYEFIPGAQGLRVPARLVVVAVLAGSLVAGLGLDLARKRQRRLTRVIPVLLLALAFAEGLADYQWMTRMPTGGQVPAVYRDLAAMDDQTVLLELPTHRFERHPMYFSTFHFRKLANGRSAFEPPVTRKLDLLTDPEWPDAFGPALLEHLLDTGVNTILVKRGKIGQPERRTILRRLNGLGCLRLIESYPNRDMLFRLNATRGDPGDTKPTPWRRFEPGPGQPIELPGEEAYQVNLGRSMKQAVVDGALHLYEPNQVRWLAKIPPGLWRLTLVARDADNHRNAGRPVTLSIRIADRPVLEKALTGSGVHLRSRPLSIAREAYYTVECAVTHQPRHAGLRLELDRIRLIPLSRKESN